VAQAGVDLFLVPAGQSDLEEAREVVGDDVEIVEVATVDDALEVLADHGGDEVVAVQQSDG
jgi:PDZ domain-containing secreted protein